jgi:putative membrane protein
LNRSSAATAAHYLARSILLAGFAFFIVHLVRSGSLNLYIAQRMQLIVKLSALAMYAVAAQQLYAAIRTWFDHRSDAPSCDCNHEMPATWGKSMLLYGWFALPLALGFLVPDGMLGSSFASAKGVQFAPQQIVRPFTEIQSPQVTVVPFDDSESDDSPVSALDSIPNLDDESLESTVTAETDTSSDDTEARALDILFPTDEFTESYAKFGKKLVKQDLITVEDSLFIETLTTLDLYRTAFIGKEVKLSGFVYREDTMGKQQFGVSRFAISCCSADASPYGVMVKFGKADTLATDEWVTVTGKLGTSLYNDIEIIEIDADKIVKITAPEDPYVTQNLDFGLE